MSSTCSIDNRCKIRFTHLNANSAPWIHSCFPACPHTVQQYLIHTV